MVSSVMCHVTWHVIGNAVGHQLLQREEKNVWRLRAEVSDLRWLVFVFVSGTAVAPTESCELSRFEIP
jgi:hypothetical protein